MSETQRLWSWTTMARLALGTSDGLVRWRTNEVAGGAYDNFDILKAFVDKGERDAAIKWLNDLPFASSKKAAARGTDLHKAAELLALGQQPKVEPHIQPYLDQYLRFLDEHQPEFLMAEAPCYHVSAGYAGTCDGVMVLQGKRLVFDYKSTAHSPDSGRSRPPFPEVALQLTAYRRSELVGILSEQRYSSGKRYYILDSDAEHEPFPETDGAVCIVISPFDYTVTPVRTDDAVWAACRHVIECARWQVETSQNVFGPQITARIGVPA